MGKGPNIQIKISKSCSIRAKNHKIKLEKAMKTNSQFTKSSDDIQLKMTEIRLKNDKAQKLSILKTNILKSSNIDKLSNKKY